MPRYVVKFLASPIRQDSVKFKRPAENAKKVTARGWTVPKVFSFKVARETKTEIKKTAKDLGLTITEFVAVCALQFLDETEPRRRRCARQTK